MLQRLSPGGYSRHRDWDSLRRENGCVDWRWLADCHPSVESHGLQAGQHCSCELRSSCVIVHHRGRAVTPFEQIPAYGQQVHDMGCKLPIFWYATAWRAFRRASPGGWQAMECLFQSRGVFGCTCSAALRRVGPPVSRLEGSLSRGELVDEFDDW